MLPIVAFLACPLLLVAFAFGVRAMAGAAASMANAEAALAANPRRIDALRRQLRGVQVEPATPRATEPGAPSGGPFAVAFRSDEPSDATGAQPGFGGPSLTWR